MFSSVLRLRRMMRMTMPASGARQKVSGFSLLTNRAWFHKDEAAKIPFEVEFTLPPIGTAYPEDWPD